MSETQKKEYPIDPLALYKFKKCQQCKYFNSDKNTCRMCGCNVKMIVNEEKSECPIGKW